jgi:hypothetical protein
MGSHPGKYVIQDVTTLVYGAACPRQLRWLPARNHLPANRSLGFRFEVTA